MALILIKSGKLKSVKVASIQFILFLSRYFFEESNNLFLEKLVVRAFTVAET